MPKSPPATVREAWCGYIDAGDYDAHMARNGQAQANARLVESLLARYPPPGHRLLIAGAGTGQWLELGDSLVSRFQTTCTDINGAFLARLSARAARSGREVETVIDDLEDTRLPASFDAAVIVLVFEHIDWRRGIASLARLGVERAVVIVQENPADQPSLVASANEPVGTMRVFVSMHPKAVPVEELEEAFRSQGFGCMGTEIAAVPDGKRMIGAVFKRQR
jgi:Methyltransferase domain